MSTTEEPRDVLRCAAGAESMTPPIPTEKADMNANKIDDGGPAFPLGHPGMQERSSGMTLRDYFAASALGGLCNDYEACSNSDEWNFAMLAKSAYLAADAMIAARAALAKANGA